MNLLWTAPAFLAALLHVLIFCMESLWFMQPKIYRRFGADTPEQAEAVRLFAYNQGFYNLFLALGVLLGLAWPLLGGQGIVGQSLALFGCACMLGAALVLRLSAGPRMLRAAVMQGLFPALAWAAWLLSEGL